MSIFDVLTLIGGLCLFLFGMNIMGQALERRAGNSLKILLSKLTTNTILGFLTGFVVTSIIQSSSATTVMVVGFVNSGLMTLRQAINVIIGANVGTTVTGWILSMETISGEGALGDILKFLKPSSFTPILALIGIAFYMFSKSTKRKDTGTILLGFAVLMFGMEAMSGSVEGLQNSPKFAQLFIMFENPILGVLAGAILTAIIQSSSASVGILQVLSDTGKVTIGASIPIVMGQAIGTCVTAVISCFGTNRNAKSAAMAHLLFNVFGTIIWLVAYVVVDAVISPEFLGDSATRVTIATFNTLFKLGCTLMFLPLTSMLEKLSLKLVPETKNANVIAELDERLLATPALALDRANALVRDMAKSATFAMKEGMSCLVSYDKDKAEAVRRIEDETDHLEDVIGSYLVRFSSGQLSRHDSAEAAKLLKIIGDFERISDHAVGIVRSAEEMREKDMTFSDVANSELATLIEAMNETVDQTCKAFVENDGLAAQTVEALEDIIDKMKTAMRNGHIVRLQEGKCSIELGFIWSDIITNLERTSDHCSNVADCVLDSDGRNLNLHESLRSIKASNQNYKDLYDAFSEKYLSRT